MTDISKEAVEALIAQFGRAPQPHRSSGETVLEVVYADPGQHGFYYREKKPDSVAAYVRADTLAALVAEVARLMGDVSYLRGVHDDSAAMIREAEAEFAALRATAQAVIDRWDTPLWKDVGPTADVINRLRSALTTPPASDARVREAAKVLLEAMGTDLVTDAVVEKFNDGDWDAGLRALTQPQETPDE